MKFLRIGETYYNVEKIEKINFRELKNDILNMKLFFIKVNDEEIQIENEEKYREIIDNFVSLVGEYNIYE